MNRSTVTGDRLSNDLTMYNQSLTRWFNPDDHIGQTHHRKFNRSPVRQSHNFDEKMEELAGVNIAHNSSVL